MADRTRTLSATSSSDVQILLSTSVSFHVSPSVGVILSTLILVVCCLASYFNVTMSLLLTYFVCSTFLISLNVQLYVYYTSS
jgi:hypothetical protein